MESKDAPKETLDFMKAWLGKETQAKLAAEGLSIPIVKGTAETIQSPFYKALAVEVDHSGGILRGDGSWARDGSSL